ncbi:MAG: sodium pump decarboxylase gamma subunit [Candidatus Choladocola sp.]|nr:sodium pump decarboxylase gamma subunit [Candidatus Choladocola sp.]
MNQNIMIALEIMWKGMAGIFAAVLIIMLFVYLMGKAGKK